MSRSRTRQILPTAQETPGNTGEDTALHVISQQPLSLHLREECSGHPVEEWLMLLPYKGEYQGSDPCGNFWSMELHETIKQMSEK